MPAALYGEPARRADAPDAGPLTRAAWLACARSPAYFLDRCGHIYDPQARGWIPFRLWPAQAAALEQLASNRLAVVLKARQLGMSWLAVGFALWQMLFRPAATVLLFSQRDDEAVHLLNFRLRGMYDRLPRPFRARAVVRDNAHECRLSNGSAALAFPTTGGRSYTASLAIVDEADHTDDLDGLLNAVKPTVDAGGRLVLLSTVDKSRPESPFKRIYRAAAADENDYAAIFLPWHAHPSRTEAWYAGQVRDIRARTGGLDDLHQEYPATDLEALAPRAVDKFFPAAWLDAAYGRLKIEDERLKTADGGLRIEDGRLQIDGTGSKIEDERLKTEDHLQSSISDLQSFGPGLAIHALPRRGRAYVIGADPAGGNPQSDESAAIVLDSATGEQVATLGLRCDPEMFAVHLHRLAGAYNGADILVERNNHGHAVILVLRQLGAALLSGPDGQPGWATTAASKHLAFDQAARDIRERGLRLHDETTYRQLASVEGATLAAPPGQHDDRAVACVLALAGVRLSFRSGRGLSFLIPPAPLWPGDTGGGETD